jgi:hypothetical protein
MDTMSNLDLTALAQDPEFKSLTVEQAIRLLGEREKQQIEKERTRVVEDLKARLQEKGAAIKGSR